MITAGPPLFPQPCRTMVYPLGLALVRPLRRIPVVSVPTASQPPAAFSIQDNPTNVYTGACKLGQMYHPPNVHPIFGKLGQTRPCAYHASSILISLASAACIVTPANPMRRARAHQTVNNQNNQPKCGPACCPRSEFVPVPRTLLVHVCPLGGQWFLRLKVALSAPNCSFNSSSASFFPLGPPSKLSQSRTLPKLFQSLKSAYKNVARFRKS